MRDGDIIVLGKRVRIRFEAAQIAVVNGERTLDQIDSLPDAKTIVACTEDKTVISAPAENVENPGPDAKTLLAFPNQKARDPGCEDSRRTPGDKPRMKSVSLPGLEIGAATDPGSKRRDQPNQDAILVIPPEKDHPTLFIVADGMGGHAAGDQASRLVVEAVASRYRQPGKIEDMPALLHQCLRNAFDALEKYAAGREELSSMGSTVVLAVPNGGQVVIANVGDSRAYRLRHAGSRIPPASGRFSLKNWFQQRQPAADDPQPDVEILQLSYDHSVVAELVRGGQLTPAQALQSPLRNRLTQSITPRQPDFQPFFNQVSFEQGDTLLLCTDGVWGVVPEASLAAIALELTPQEAADKLVKQAINYGGPDNISMIIARRT